MGTGRLKAGAYDVTAAANFVMAAGDWADWERALKKASEILFDATEGQLQFGTFYVCDDSVGLDTADIILYDSGDPSFSSGRFGEAGAAIHLMPYVKNAILTVLHEWGHHAWDLGEEYSAPLLRDAIDTAAPAPDQSTIPIVDSGRADDELVALQAEALLMIADQVERRAVTANTATTVTVGAPFSVLPTDADVDTVWYQTPAECAEVAGSNFCIMENSRTAAGQFDAGGNWVPAANPVTEYCTPGNHDPDGDTKQEADHGASCWEVITATAGYGGLVMPDPAAAGPAVGFTVPGWIVLDKQLRFALVLDRSGSMATGHKMADAQHGAVYWLEFCAQGTDLLTVVWYDHAQSRILDLTQVNTLASLDPVIDDINALAPRGSTNIRDALGVALDQINSVGTRAATQVALLLTDGMHNTPPASSASEALADYQDGGCRIYSLGVGEPDQVDMDTLDQLAAETGGRSYAVGDNQPGDVEAAMVEINAEVRGGIITTQPALMPDAKESPLTGPVAEWARRKRRPSLEQVLDALKVKSLNRLLKPDRRLAPFLVAIPVFVEEGCGRASFTLVHPAGEDLWLYLIGPDGTPVAMDGPGVRHVTSSAPHEFAIVMKPAPGTWHMVAVRPGVGAAFRFRAIAGGENRKVQVFGGAPPLNPSGAPVRLHASGRWGEPLSGLRVWARVWAPDGRRHRVALSEGDDPPKSGVYEAGFLPPTTGRFRAEIHIESTGRCTGAQPLQRMTHLERGRSLSFAVDAPRFQRIVLTYFDVGPRPKVADREKTRGLPDRHRKRRRRPVPLKSARRTIDEKGKQMPRGRARKRRKG